MANTALFIFFIAQLLRISFFAFAQGDPTLALIGKWEGQIEVTYNSGRVLVINSVQATGSNEWIARGRFGVPGIVDTTKPGGQEMNVLSRDNAIFIEFRHAATSTPVRLKLVGENRLEGTVNTWDTRGPPRDRRIALEKVKVGETK